MLACLGLVNPCRQSDGALQS